MLELEELTIRLCFCSRFLIILLPVISTPIRFRPQHPLSRTYCG